MNKFIIDKDIFFYDEKTAFTGVIKTAENVKRDIELVVGAYPHLWNEGREAKFAVIYGTLGRSPILDDLEQRGKIDFSEVRGKWEVYSFSVMEEPIKGIDNAVVIAGSDKRGTIYGLYHLSELIGVSPLVNWNHVWPKKREEVVLTEADNIVSREPSVKYRGFFINDEWPAFGTWAKEHFGGINAACYENIFELLLRLKGNYLWPAMWDSDFSLDGPGLMSAELADEYGVVMSTSHHEPCMRSGAEYGKVRGKDSEYGDAWDFRSNPEGITRFWRDGLLRNKNFDNVITLGMRGENDTAILKNATLKDNIDLLRDVIKTQNRLIKEIINPDLSKVPRQIVLFTEVEEFFYGSDETPGLMNDPELEGVTLMLSDNNHGSTRTLPSEKMRNHNGGYGMYYHMDMHGGAYSFQWIGSTYLPKLWEQMTAAYEFGVKEIWVTNIGDIGTQEFGLSYFLDLAYDIEKWGGRDAGITQEYTKQWLHRQFSSFLHEGELLQLEKVFSDYTRLLARRKHEIMNDEVYHPIHYGEAEEVLKVSQSILDTCDALKKNCPEDKLAAFISLAHYPASGTANLMKMWILSGRNKLYAKQNRVEANILADEVKNCFDVDEKLTEEYMEVDNRTFYGFGLSEHIGFTTWCDEDNKYPLLTYVHPANHPRMILARCDDENYLTGDFWRDKPQVWSNALRQDVNKIQFEIACGSSMPIRFKIETTCSWLSFSIMEGIVSLTEKVELTVHKEMINGRVSGEFTVENVGHGKATIIIEAQNAENLEENVFVEADNYIAMEAAHFQRSGSVEEGSFHILSPYGRTGSAIKIFPVTADFTETEKRPYTEYHFIAQQSGEYNIRFYMAATTPVVYERKQYIGFSVNEEDVKIVNSVREEDKQFFLSQQWTDEAYSNIKLVDDIIICKKGLNKLRFLGMSPAIVLERIVLHPVGTVLPESYLGPRESYRNRPAYRAGENSLGD